MGAARILFLLGLVGCGHGSGGWFVDTWGEEFIEQGIPSIVFADGCSVEYDTFALVFARVSLIGGEYEDEVGDMGREKIYDLTVPGPVEMGFDTVRAGHYNSVEVHVGPDEDAISANASTETVAEMKAAGASVFVAGKLTCPNGSARFTWLFDPDTQYDCEPYDLTIPVHAPDRTQLTIHGDWLFLSSLENPDAAIRGQAMLDADTNSDRVVTLEELDAVSVAELGYELGSWKDVTTLRAFVTHLAGTVVHIDGDGECEI